MSAVHAPETRPPGDATTSSETAQRDEEHSSDLENGPLGASTDPPNVQQPDQQYDGGQSSLPVLARSFVKALYDHGPAKPEELPLEKGDLIECLGRTDPDVFRGVLRSGRNKGRTGIYAADLVSNIDPTDPDFHDALTARSGSEGHCGPSVQGNRTGQENHLKIASRLDRVLTPVEEEASGLTIPGSHHDSVSHQKLSVPQEEPRLDDEPAVLGSIARQDSDIRPDLLLPGSHDIPEEYSTIEKLLKNNPNYGAKTRDFLPSRSAPLQQLRENRERTPPVPCGDAKSGFDGADDLTDIQARCRQLRSQLFDAGKPDLFYTLTRSQDSSQPKTAVLSIAALQHMALHQLQYDISCYVGLMYRTSQFYMELQGFPPLVELMNSYCKSHPTILRKQKGRRESNTIQAKPFATSTT